MCSVVHPFSGKRDAASSLHSASIPQSAGLLGITSAGVFPGTLQASPNVQHHDQGSLSGSETNICSAEGGSESLGSIEAAGGQAGLLGYEQNKDQDLHMEKDSTQALPVLYKKPKGVGSIESITILSEDEDNCPICLEEYDSENPRIDTVCEHHFHLGCILEWMERSDSCPICDKEMVFNESP